jgi:glycosyltransferase involved in cell wall biosynthesis
VSDAAQSDTRGARPRETDCLTCVKTHPFPDAITEETRITADALTHDTSPVAARRLTVMVVVPTLGAGAAERGAVDLAHVLIGAGHRVVVVSHGGRMEEDLADDGATFVRRNVHSKNPFTVLRNAGALTQLARKHRCDVIHAHGRAPAWSAYLAARVLRIPFVTSWYKGFREQNPLKRFYNRIMVRGQRVVAAGDQIAELINDRYGTAWDRIVTVPASVDVSDFDPDAVSAERLEAMRRAWGATAQTQVILVLGRMVRRKGHHLVVQSARRMKDMGIRNFLCILCTGEEGMSRYACEIWDLVVASDAADVCRIVNFPADKQAAFAAATIAVSAATQAEGTARAVLEAQAMALPLVVSDLATGPEVVLAPPAVPDDRMTGLRFSSGDERELSAAIVRLLSMSQAQRQAVGRRGRAWVSAQFTPSVVSDRLLRLYEEFSNARGG